MSNSTKASTTTDSNAGISQNRRMRAVISVVAVLLLIVGIALSRIFGWPMNTAGADSESALQTEVRRLPVRVTEVEFVSKIQQKRTYTGLVRPKQQAELGFELTGRIESIQGDEGDHVTKGTMLAHLDTKALIARKAATQASLNQANAVLDELRAGPRQQTIASMRAQLDESSSNLKLAELNLERRRKLRESRAISNEDFDRALYIFRAAKSKVDSLAKQLDELEAGTRPEQIAAQQAAVQGLSSSLAEIDVQIEKSTIFAPFDGRIVQRLADPGGIATTSMPILKLVDVNYLEAVIGVPTDAAQALHSEDEYSIVVAGQSYPAELIAKIQQLDMATRTQDLIFQLGDEANEIVLPGQLCQIEIETEIAADGFWVPSSSLTNGIRGLWSLMVINDENSRAARSDVQVLYSDGDRALVKGSIAAGTQVIVEGTHRIVEGQHVQPLLRQANQAK